MSKKTLAIFVLTLVAASTTTQLRAASPQEPKSEQAKEQQSGKGVLQSSGRNHDFYRVEYAIYELDHGKRTNARNFMLKAEEGSRSSFRVGNRVPIPSPSGSGFTFENVGVNIDSWVKVGDTGVSLHSRININSMADSETANHPTPPVFRSFELEDDSLVDPAKSTLIGGIDDAASNRRYEIEVTVTRNK